MAITHPSPCAFDFAQLFSAASGRCLPSLFFAAIYVKGWLYTARVGAVPWLELLGEHAGLWRGGPVLQAMGSGAHWFGEFVMIVIVRTVWPTGA